MAMAFGASRPVASSCRSMLRAITPRSGLKSLSSSVPSPRSGFRFEDRIRSTRQRHACRNVRISISVRYYSSSNHGREKKILPPDQQASYDRLRPIIDTFEAPIDWAVAYGSGVMKQAQVKPGDPPSLTDLLLSTPSPIDFHTLNLRQNPTHYPLHARLMGAKGIAHIQERWGAGVWYVTDVKINGISVKYGIISTPSLITDLTLWKTCYLSGRLHKPTLSLIHPSAPQLQEALERNLQSALSLALLLITEERFTEDELWEKIAGLSYSGDPRMGIPGGENPQKIRNIVRGPGAREGFRNMYGRYFEEKGLRWVEGEKNVEGKVWTGDGEGLLCKPTSPEYHIELFNSLPTNLRQSVYKHFEHRQAIGTSEKEALKQVVQDTKFNSSISTELRNIIHTPALRQSVKGLFTAGFTKSFWYALAKFRKWLKGRGGK